MAVVSTPPLQFLLFKSCHDWSLALAAVSALPFAISPFLRNSSLLANLLRDTLSIASIAISNLSALMSYAGCTPSARLVYIIGLLLSIGSLLVNTFSSFISNGSPS